MSLKRPAEIDAGEQKSLDDRLLPCNVEETVIDGSETVIAWVNDNGAVKNVPNGRVTARTLVSVPGSSPFALRSDDNRFAKRNVVNVDNRIVPGSTVKSFDSEIAADNAGDEIKSVSGAGKAMPHILLRAPGFRVRCFLCLAQGRECKVAMTCVGCGKGFHVNCHAMFHNVDLFINRSDVVSAVLMGQHRAKEKSRNKRSKNMPTFEDAALGI